jgi:hypothetical protein
MNTKPTTAAQVLAEFQEHGGNSLKWLNLANRLDPKGRGTLNEQTKTIFFSYTDGSSLILDTRTETLYLPQ